MTFSPETYRNLNLLFLIIRAFPNNGQAPGKDEKTLAWQRLCVQQFREIIGDQ
jgi:hypothetical protein